MGRSAGLGNSGAYASRGYPRAVNNVALHAMTAAFTRDNPIVDEKAARTAVAEVTSD